MDEKFKKHFNEIRVMGRCSYEDLCLEPIQPGLFRSKTKILFIGTNPGTLKPELIPSDKILIDNEVDDADFHAAYEKSQRAWKFYDYISKICKWEDASIITVCRCPTKNNEQPSLKMIENCEKFLFTSIELINPKYIVCVGKISYERVKRLNLSIKVIKSNHYSFLLRKGTNFYNNEIKSIRRQIQNAESSRYF